MNMLRPTCPDCGRPLPAGGPEGLCPACLMCLAEPGADTGTAGDICPELGASGDARAGDHIDRYKLLEIIGEGGFGTVWMAEQAEPVRRRVALKILKLGMDTRQVVARFEAERQALALMDHPNIAKVFDGGATNAGRPFFVMELVRGLPLIAFCDAGRLNTRERLELFLSVCQAVQHAHQKGVIHRDLKPTNILVTEQDGRPVPKVIDFGIAKATEQRLTEKTLFTRFNQMVGTPAYMSPEQAGLGGLDVDTRTDIYALGVLLYELLTGRTPLDPQQLRGAGYEAMVRSIREAEAAKPSTRVSTLRLEELTALAGRRSEDPQRLRGLLRGDLDWIALKALEKDRARRYQSASDLAADLQRYLGSEPIAARPPSNLYRLQKLARRHTLAFAAGSAVLVALIGGLVATSWQWIRAKRHLRQADLNAYVSDVGLAQQALAVNNLSRARELLDRQRPKPGEKEDLRGFEWRYLWQFSQPDPSATFPGGRYDVEFSPDGSLLAITSETNTVIRETASQRVVTNLPGGAVSLAFSPRDRVLAVAEDGQVRLWSTETWREVRPPLKGVGFPVRFSPDGAWLLTGDPKTQPNPRHQLWRTDTWQSVGTCAATPEYPWQTRNVVAFSPDGSLVATPWLKVSAEICGLRLWKVPSLEEAGFIHSEDIAAFSSAFLPDGRHLLIGTFYGDLIVWDLEKWAVAQRTKVVVGNLTTISVAPEANLFVTTGNDQSVRLWDARSLKELKKFHGHTGSIWGSAITPDGRLVASGSSDGTAKLWDGTARESAGVFKQGSLIAGFSSDSRALVLAPREGDYRWHLLGPTYSTVEVPTNPSLRIDLLRRPFDVFGARPIAMLGRTDGTIELWDLAAGRMTNSWRDGTNEITAARFSADGTLLATGNDRGQVKLWNVRTGEELPLEIAENPLHGAVSSLVFSPDRQTLASGNHFGSGDVLLWDLESKGRPRRLPGQGSDVTSIAFSPDGRRLAASTSSSLDSVTVWDFPSLQPYKSLKGHMTGTFEIAFSPDGKTLATGGYDVVKLWNLATRDEVAILPMDRGVFRGLRFSPDGRTLALGYFGFPGHFVRQLHAPSLEEIAAEEAREAPGLR